MRMLPGHYTVPKAQQTKPPSGKVEHVAAPLKGLSLSTKLVTGDPLTATLLDNWVIEESQIKCRPGTGLVWDYAKPAKPVERLITYTGSPNRLAAAIDHELRLFDGTLVHGGFTSDDWHWTFFSNLGDKDYTVMVNGKDGVWSWDGGTTADPAPMSCTVTKTNPATVVVSSTDIGKFSNGMVVTISGITDAAMLVANGPHIISKVGIPANTMTLSGVNCLGGAANSAATIDIPGSMYKETVTAPPLSPHVDPDSLDIVISHQNRLFFASKTGHAFYYLPIQQKSGELAEFPLNAVFLHGGTIRAMASWTVDGGAGMDDVLVIFSTNGECVVYRGVDPSDVTDWGLVGIFHFDAPMSKHSVMNYGGDLFIMISTGLVPMTTLMRTESEKLGKADTNVTTAFTEITGAFRGSLGWQVILDQTSGRMICNMPTGSGMSAKQMVRFMPNPIWSSWSGIPARCWAWLDNRLFFGTPNGKVGEMSPLFLGDYLVPAAPLPIEIDLLTAWSKFRTNTIKQFKLIKPFTTSDGVPRPYLDVHIGYNCPDITNWPDVTQPFAEEGATWDVARWDEDPADDGWYWITSQRYFSGWTGVGRTGTIGAVRFRARILDCTFALSGFDVTFEEGKVFG